MNANTRLAAFVICVACAHAGAETYTWTGGGANNLWSNPLNWQDGLVPVSSSDSIIHYQSSEFDLGTNFDVGTLHGHSLTSVSGDHSIRVHQALIGPSFGQFITVPLTVAGNVSLEGRTDFLYAILESALDVIGEHRIALEGTGSVHVGIDSHLEAWSNSRLTSLTGSGVFNLIGDVEMLGSEPADLSHGTLDLGSNYFVADPPGHATLSVDGDLKLGNWLVSGWAPSYPTEAEIDRIDVTGELDLTQATLDPESYAEPLTQNPYPTHLVIATYGNRIGSLPQTSIPFHRELLFDAPIIYTSGENAGPGEIWVVIPEPTTFLSLAILIPLTLRGRR